MEMSGAEKRSQIWGA